MPSLPGSKKKKEHEKLVEDLKQQLDEERKRANDFSAILHDIETNVFNETNNLLVTVSKPQYDRPSDDEKNAKQIVDILARELRAYIDKMKVCEDDFKELKRTFTAKWQKEVEDQMREFHRTTNVQETRTQLHNKVIEISELEARLSRLEVAYKTQGESLKSNLRQELRLEENRLGDLFTAKRIRFEKDIHALNVRSDNLQSQLDFEKATRKKEIARLLQDHGTAMSKMVSDHEGVKAQLEAQISQLERDHATKQDEARRKFEASKLSWQKQMAQNETALNNEHAKNIKQLQKSYAEEKERLRKNVNEYSTALLTRDDFKPMSDAEIKAKFLGLVQDVDALARLEWKVDQSEYPGQGLQRLSQTQKTLKRQLLQDSIWVLLHEYIFCNPFRIFGEEGKKLQDQWSQEFGDSTTPEGDNLDHTWPIPSMEAERWRYVTVKECRTALREPASQWDPRANLKRDFKTSLDTLRKECSLMLEKVSTLDRSSVQAMEKLTMKAANIWLEFGMQRCRILVEMQGSNLISAQEKIQRAQTSTLVMVVKPEVRRIGNSKGLDLTVEEIVGGCEGETVEASMR